MSNQRQRNNYSFREENKIYAMLRIHSKWMLVKGDDIIRRSSYMFFIVVTNIS